MIVIHFCKKTTLFLFLLFLTPLFASAQVVINEIAWMGSDNGGTSSANSSDEWIELRNVGNESVTLSGWILESTDGKPSIVLDGTIEPQGYFLLERTDDNSVPNSIADFIYVGALGNTGETLVLRDGNGVEIDRVVGGEDWSIIGGDNDLKHTPQRTGSSWVTAPPTPGAANVSGGSTTEESGTEENNESKSPPSTSSQSSPSGGSSFPVEPQIFADAGNNRTVTVGADSEFIGKATGLIGEPLLDARFIWNFGNGETQEGRKVLHHYTYPGQYVVVLTVSSGKYAASDRTVVTARSANIIISKVDPTFIELQNNDTLELNLSWWILTSGGKQFTIPKDTILLPGNTLRLGKQVTDLVGSDDAMLWYPNGTAAYTYEPYVAPVVVSSVPVVAIPPPTPVTTFEQPVISEEPAREDDISRDEVAAVAAARAQEFNTPSPKRKTDLITWISALLGIIGIAVLSVLSLRKKGETTTEEITILENDNVEKKQ